MIPIFSRMNGLVFGLMILMVFSLGATVGASAAISGDMTQTQVEQNISKVDEKVVKDVRNDTSGIHEDIVAPLAKSSAESAIGIANLGVGFGYQYPGIAEVLAWVNALAALAAVAIQVRRVAKS